MLLMLRKIITNLYNWVTLFVIIIILYPNIILFDKYQTGVIDITSNSPLQLRNKNRMTIKKKTWSSLRSLHFYYLPNIERMDASSLLHLKIKRNCACLRLKCSLLHSVLKIKTKNKLIISKKQRSKSIQNQSMS